MRATRWWKYLEKLIANGTADEAAKRIGISASNFSRWKNGARADPDFVVKIARAYDQNVIDALVEAEFITDEEANLREVDRGGLRLEEATDVQLLDELLRRLGGT